jgi:hypothetical protein
MSRFVVPSGPGLVKGEGEPPDGLETRIVKYVPAEILSIFTMAIGGVASSKPPQQTAELIAIGLIVVFCIGTLAYFACVAPKGPVKQAHMVVSTFAFLAWSYPISSALLGQFFVGWAAIVLQALVLLLAAIIAPVKKE